MTVTEVKQALGSWELRLRDNTPRSILDRLTYFGHIVITPNRIPPAQYGDNLLSSARYVGVYRNRSSTDEYLLRGSGMAFWLGDEDGKGDVLETEVSLTGASFSAAITALLPPSGAVTAGTFYSVAGTYTNTHRWQTPRQAIEYATQTFGAEWRVNGNGTLDAGLATSLYNTTPRAIILRKAHGRDLVQRSFRGQLELGTDSEDYTTRVVLLGEGEGDQISTGSADLPAPTPFKDIHGNLLQMVRLISESSTTEDNANVRAEIYLGQYSTERQSVNLSTSAYDIKGEVAVGDWLNVYDPASGLIDPANEIYWLGQPINALQLRCIELTWPIPDGWTVAFRDINGVWIDLSPYYAGEAGDTTVIVGDLSRSLVTAEPVGVRPNLPESPSADLTIPNSPTFTAFEFGSYQSGTTNTTKAVIRVTWSLPTNTDSSTITDGHHYELRWRVSQVIGYRVLWGQVAGYRWGQLNANRWGTPLSNPVADSAEWHYMNVPWGTNTATITELTPGVIYEIQIQAVDSAYPPHLSGFSASEFQTTIGDLFAPSTPDAPTVAGSLTAIQVTHTLGKASGGLFNLEPDLDHLEIHVGGSDDFYAGEDTLIGRLAATAAMISASIPAIGTFQIPQVDEVYVKVRAVDRAGNKSGASVAATVTAVLIDDAHISDLSVSKITAGTITANWILAAAIRTALTGARIEVTSTGIRAYNADEVNTFDVDAATGDVTIVGELTTTDVDGQYVRVGVDGIYGPSVILQPPDNEDGSRASDAGILSVQQGSGLPNSVELYLYAPSYGNLGDRGSFYWRTYQNGDFFTVWKTNDFGGAEVYMDYSSDANISTVGVAGTDFFMDMSSATFGFTTVGFFDKTPISRPTVTGSRGGNAALASLCIALANLGLIINSTS